MGGGARSLCLLFGCDLRGCEGAGAKLGPLRNIKIKDYGKELSDICTSSNTNRKMVKCIKTNIQPRCGGSKSDDGAGLGMLSFA